MVCEKHTQCDLIFSGYATTQQWFAFEQELFIRFDTVPEPIRKNDCIVYIFYLCKKDFDKLINCAERFNDDFNCPQVDYRIDGN